ncbi:MAG: serine hydrolase [Ferruginibacter sp.]
MRYTRYCFSAAFFAMVLMASCSAPKKVTVIPDAPVPVVTAPVPVNNNKTDAFLEKLLVSNPQFFSDVVANKDKWNVQVIYTQVDRGANGIPALKNYYFNVNPANYFYPASTVKFPVSLLALQRLNELKEKGIDKNTTMITEAGTTSQTAVYNDPSTPDGRPSIAHYIKKIMLVSDNDAYNRLYEFLGQDYINNELHKKGYGDVQLLHRLQLSLPADENRKTNPVKFLDASGNVLYDQPLQNATAQYVKRSDSMGTGYMQGGQLVNGAMDFSLKNRISLEDLHNILISLVFPNKVPSSQRFNLTDADREFLFKYMSQLPTETLYPPYADDTARYNAAGGKYFIFGGDEKNNYPKHIRIFNKTGGAYGQLLDVAYIVDYAKKVEFFLSAVIYCNSDGIINDDKYDYDQVGRPFLKNLGQVMYDYESQRNKKHLPDFSDFIFYYDKD